ncbi:MAG: hypothetical protein J07HN6_00723 [Halonotius sp. J07HN6]|nr:MAG: hypothetical protein J07HN6_00723 [Halonotius sp. J07HN6]
MAGDVSRPFGDVKGYQFWALFGVGIILLARISMASNIPLGPFTATIFETSQFRIIITDLIGIGMVASGYLTYREFVN